jgi:hypothetical protein
MAEPDTAAATVAEQGVAPRPDTAGGHPQRTAPSQRTPWTPTPWGARLPQTIGHSPAWHTLTAAATARCWTMGCRLAARKPPSVPAGPANGNDPSAPEGKPAGWWTAARNGRAPASVSPPRSIWPPSILPAHTPVPPSRTPTTVEPERAGKPNSRRMVVHGRARVPSSDLLLGFWGLRCPATIDSTWW